MRDIRNLENYWQIKNDVKYKHIFGVRLFQGFESHRSNMPDFFKELGKVLSMVQEQNQTIFLFIPDAN